MAVTPVGNPYVESSDLVANYPGASEALAERIDIVGVNPFANAAARDAAIPSPVQGQMCSLNDDNKGYRYDGSAWVLFSGAGDANFTNAATGTYTDDGIDYKYITFTGSGELIVDQAGFADVLVIGGAGSGGQFGGGGGAGGYLSANVYLPAAVLTVTIGAGGAASTFKNGFASRLDNLFGVGGGAGGVGDVAAAYRVGQSGAAGGGGGLRTDAAGGGGTPGQGYDGGKAQTGDSSGTGGSGGGGGAGAAGGAGSGNVGAAGGAGSSSSITGGAVTRSGGGGGSGSATAGAGGAGGGGAGSTSTVGTAGTANTGGGGGGGWAALGGNGGSGVVIVRVVV